jgi:hypothetical protein
MLQLELEVHFSKTATADVRRNLAPAANLARATARHMRQRLRRRRYATRPEPFSANPGAGPRKRRRYYISPAYAHEIGAQQTSFKSSVDMHQAVGARAPGVVSGALLRSMRVRNFGRDSMVIEFAGSSLGASSTHTARTVGVKDDSGAKVFETTLSSKGAVRAKQLRELKRDKGGKVLFRRKPKKVLNRLKASAVYNHTNIGLLQPTDAESRAQVAAIGDNLSAILITTFGGVVIQEDGDKGDRRLYEAIKRGV